MRLFFQLIVIVLFFVVGQIAKAAQSPLSGTLIQALPSEIATGRE